MSFLRLRYALALVFVWQAAIACLPVRADSLAPPSEALSIVNKIYSFDLDGAMQDARRMQTQHPDEPLGYLLEAEALWWKIWCGSAEYKYGMSDARHHAKGEIDRSYLALAQKCAALAGVQLKKQDSAEMEFYAGMADALEARLYGLRGETRNTAKCAVRGREHLLRAAKLDAALADTGLGLGMYDYLVDTLSSVAKIMRFFMGIPGGSKQEGVKLLEEDIAHGVLTQHAARFYLALDLHRYDFQYQKALMVMTPLTKTFPSNPLFHLMRGDLLGKLGRKDQAAAEYRAALNSSAGDAECREHVQELARVSLAALAAPRGH